MSNSIVNMLDHFLISVVPNTKTNQVCYVIVDSREAITDYMDLTGRFPRRSSRGNKYILVSYHFDTNYIRAITMKNRRGQTITEAWE